MKILIQIFIYVAFLFSCEKKDDIKSDFSARIKNNSEYTISGISLFSLPYGELKAGETSRYQAVNFNDKEDDPMLNITIDNVFLGKYLAPKSSGKVTYIIDSIHVQDQTVFTSEIIE